MILCEENFHKNKKEHNNNTNAKSLGHSETNKKEQKQEKNHHCL